MIWNHKNIFTQIKSVKFTKKNGKKNKEIDETKGIKKSKTVDLNSIITVN